MSPPTYTDVGKASKDLFNKHYNIGIYKLNLKSKSPDGVEFNLDGVQNIDTGKVASSLESKCYLKPYGLTLKQKWNTDNILSGEATAEDYFVSGLKTGVSATLAPQSGKLTGKLSAGYVSKLLNIGSDVDCGHAGAVWNGHAVCGYLGWLAGMKVTYDPSRNKLSKTHLVLGYMERDFHATARLDDGQEFDCSIYQKLNKSLESGMNVAWSSSKNTTKIGLGCHYKIDQSLAVSAKVDSHSLIGLGLVFTLRPGVTLSCTTMYDAKNFSHGSHRQGLGINIVI